MFRKLLLFTVAAPFLLLPARLIAGGPPWLCLPIDGVTADNAEACTDLIEANLENKLWPHSEPYGGAAIHQSGDQRYLTFHMKEDVALSEIEATLKGSEFSIPRDKLRLFGHVALEIDVRDKPSKDILAALKSMDQMTLAKSEVENGLLRATVELPYPVVNDRPKREAIGWENFARNDYTSDQSTRSESRVTRLELPSYNSFRDVAVKHNASLKDIHWSTTFACRALGCVSVPDANAVIATAPKPPHDN